MPLTPPPVEEQAAISQRLERQLAVPRPVVLFAQDYPSGRVLPTHSHTRAQLIYAIAGVMSVTAAGGLWVVPPQRALWVPAGVEHGIRMNGRVAMRSAYLDPHAAAGMPTSVTVLTVSDLLRELLLRSARMPPLYDEAGAEGRLIAVLLDELRSATAAPFHLPSGRDERLRRVTAAIVQQPEDGRPLAEWAEVAGASERTLARLFLAETGMGFRAWRSQARLLQALVQLNQGQPVTTVALDHGYTSVSAFIAAFHRAFGTTPGRLGRGTGTSGNRAG
jgi:AraC-like DNA-binding protein/mannose-6-phosphate isomerase-like protein (cupin superfamily)